MHHTPFEREQRVPRIAIFLILLNGICCRLTSEMILELNRDDRKTVDEQAKVEREFRSVNGIAKLPCHTEDILFKHLLRLLVVFRRREIEHDEIRRVGLHAVSKNINDAALRDFPRKPV